MAVRTVGVMDVKVQYQDQCFELPLVIAKEAREARMPTLFGRDWLSKIKINWPQVLSVKALDKETSLAEKFREVFDGDFGTNKWFECSIGLKVGVRPVFMKARPVPYALRKRVEQKLVKL